MRYINIFVFTLVLLFILSPLPADDTSTDAEKKGKEIGDIVKVALSTVFPEADLIALVTGMFDGRNKISEDKAKEMVRVAEEKIVEKIKSDLLPLKEVSKQLVLLSDLMEPIRFAQSQVTLLSNVVDKSLVPKPPKEGNGETPSIYINESEWKDIKREWDYVRNSLKILQDAVKSDEVNIVPYYSVRQNLLLGIRANVNLANKVTRAIEGKNIVAVDREISSLQEVLTDTYGVFEFYMRQMSSSIDSLGGWLVGGLGGSGPDSEKAMKVLDVELRKAFLEFAGAQDEELL